MPFHKERYPHDWKDISKRIRERSGGRCECSGECGLHHDRRCEETNGNSARWARGKIVLTVAHLDHDTENNSDGNLKAMCQRCHLRYDRELHAKNSSRKRNLSKKWKLVMSGSTVSCISQEAFKEVYGKDWREYWDEERKRPGVRVVGNCLVEEVVG